MKKGWILAAVFVLALSLATGAFAQATKGAAPAEQPRVVKERVAVMTATVQAIDLNTRIVTLKGPKGEVRDIKVGEEAVNLPQVKVGDLVTVKFYESIAVEVIKPGTVAGAGEKSAVVRAKPGEMPRGMAARQATVTATITAIDKKEGTLSLKGPEGKTVIVKVEDPKNLDKVKVGDELMITYTEALAISLEPAPKAYLHLDTRIRQDIAEPISLGPQGRCHVNQAIHLLILQRGDSGQPGLPTGGDEQEDHASDDVAKTQTIESPHERGRRRAKLALLAVHMLFPLHYFNALCHICNDFVAQVLYIKAKTLAQPGAYYDKYKKLEDTYTKKHRPTFTGDL